MSSVKALKRDMTIIQEALNPKPEDDWVKRSQEISELLQQQQEENEVLRATLTDQEFCLLQENLFLGDYAFELSALREKRAQLYS